MNKLFVAAALAASTYALEADCCELYTEENFGGIMEEACLRKNWFNEYLESFAYSFVTTGQEDEMNDAISSYRCGSLVRADFCLGEPLKYRDLDNLTQFKCNKLAFSTDESGKEDAGPMEWMNLVSSLVLYKGGVVANDC